jgi:hypothetical protein
VSLVRSKLERRRRARAIALHGRDLAPLSDVRHSRRVRSLVALCAATLGIATISGCGSDPARSPSTPAPLVDYPPCETEATPPSHVEAAQGAHAAASRFYEKKNYTRAAELWRDAYEFDCTAHRVLINIGRAYDKQGKTREAMHAWATYVRRVGREAEPEIERRVREYLAEQPDGELPR